MMRRVTLFIAAIALTASGTLHAQAVPGIVGGAIASDNVDYVMTIPDVPAIGGKIIDGKMYVTTLRGVRIYEVSLGPPVLIGSIEYPHWQNEWVDTNGRILLVSADNLYLSGYASTLSIFDVSIPHAPILKSVLPITNGHTASCVADCRYVWTTGNDIIDIADPAKPLFLRRGNGVSVFHHADVDEAGYAFTNGTTMLNTNNYAGGIPPTYASSWGVGYGWHGAMRPEALQATESNLANTEIDPGEVVIGTDEYLEFFWWQQLCSFDGPFKTSWLRKLSNGQRIIQPLDRWQIRQGTVEGSKQTTAMCSAHWFDWHDDIVAIGWYEQGTRFLDISDPTEIQQIGYFMPAVTETWGARMNHIADGPLAGLWVYTFDVARGIDVLRFEGEAGDPLVLSPHLNEPRLDVQPSEEYGFACRLTRAGLPG